jgi:HK97 family phage major capsid protein
MKELLERRSRIVEEMRAITNAPTGTGGDLSAEQSTRFDTLKTELAGLEKNIERRQLIDAAELKMTGMPITGGRDSFENNCRQFSIQKALAHAIEPTIDAGREVEVGQELAKRAGRPVNGFMIPLEALIPERRVLTSSSGSDAVNLVATDVVASEFIDALRPQSIVIGLGGRVLTGLRDNIALPKLTALTPAAAWVADNSALTPADGTFAQVSGTPHHLGLITEISRKTLIQTNPGIESILRMDFAAKLAAAIDLAALTGDGSNKPTGITHTSSIATQTSSSSDPTWAQVVNAQTLVKSANVRGRFGWAMGSYEEAKFRVTPKIVSTNFPEFMIDDDEAPNTMAGQPYAVSTQIGGNPNSSPATAGQVIFGAWDNVITAFWSGVEILLNPFESTAFTKGNVQIRGLIDADVLIRHPEAFCYWSSIKLS